MGKDNLDDHSTTSRADPLKAITDPIYDIPISAPGPEGSLPLTDDMLKTWSSGDLFGLSQNAGMGWEPHHVLDPNVLILSTQGGIRSQTGRPVALGYHTGHWEVGLLAQKAAETFRAKGFEPFAAQVTDPCDGRSQGTVAMFDSLPFRNDAAIVLRRLIRSLPTRRGVMGIATCDKGLPAMMMALASLGKTAGILVPGGVTLLAENGEDAGQVQTIGARFSRQMLTLSRAQTVACSACASPGGGCQFLGTAATAQVVGEALGMSLPHTALIPSGQPIWKLMAEESAEALTELIARGVGMQDIVTDAAIQNAMVVHAAFGGSTNLFLHLAAIAHAAGRSIPDREDWERVNRETPRLVSVLPNGPIPYPTAVAFLAGGVPEVLRHLGRLGLLNTSTRTVSGKTVGEVIDWWDDSERRYAVRRTLQKTHGIDPDQVIMDAPTAKRQGMTSTLAFPTGNVAPEGAIVKSTAIDPSVLDSHGIYHHRGCAKVFTTEHAAILAIKEGRIEEGDILVLAGRGPAGTGMEETAQLTAALKYLPFGKHVTLITDARFSGFSTGACIGQVSPEALAGGPIGKLRDGDLLDVVIDTHQLTGAIDFVGSSRHLVSPDEGRAILRDRPMHPDIRPDPDLPDDTRLWAALQAVSGGPWRGSIYDVDRILEVLSAGQKSLEREHTEAMRES